MMTEPLLSARELIVGYAGVAVLPAVDLQIRPGELWGLVGANGAGKSTLLRTLLGLLPRVGGVVDRASGLRTGYVPQRSELDMTGPRRVVDVVRGGAEQGWSFLSPLAPLRAREAVRRALRDAHAEALAGAQLSELSEGQKQRVLLARALASEPAVLVLDEPTSAMDGRTERAVYTVLQELRAARSLAVLMVSHHVALLAEHATHLVLVDREDGLALVGPAATVAASEAFTERWGRHGSHTGRG